MPAPEESPKKEVPETEKEVFSWTAPARPFKRRDRRFYTTLIATAGIVGLVLFLAEGFMPVILLISIIFLFYIMSTVEPEKIEYGITNKGIKIGGQTTFWEIMTRFWFSKRFDSEILVIETVVLPGRLELVINVEDKEKVKQALAAHIPEEEVSPSLVDKASSWFSKKLSQS